MQTIYCVCLVNEMDLPVHSHRLTLNLFLPENVSLFFLPFLSLPRFLLSQLSFTSFKTLNISQYCCPSTSYTRSTAANTFSFFSFLLIHFDIVQCTHSTHNPFGSAFFVLRRINKYFLCSALLLLLSNRATIITFFLCDSNDFFFLFI